MWWYLCVIKKGAMAARKTVAIIASTNEKIVAIISKLSLEDSRLLLVSKYPNQFTELSRDVACNHPNVELEIIDCMKDGCWEADIIILDIAYDEETEVTELIKEVSTQKIVVSFSKNENSELQNLLKHSKVVIAAVNPTNSTCITFSGEDHDAVQEVLNILKNSEESKVTI